MRKCGAELDDNAKFCPSCGANQDGGSQHNKTDFSEKINEFANTEDHTGECDNADIAQNKVYAIFAYLSWLVLIPILAAPKSKFARFHANQGLVLAIIVTIWNVFIFIVNALLFAIIPLVWVISVISSLVNLAFLALMIIGIVNVAQGKAKELPIIGKVILIK